MNREFTEALSGLEGVDCTVYAGMLVRMLAALSDAIDECASPRVRNQIVERFLDLSGEG